MKGECWSTSAPRWSPHDAAADPRPDPAISSTVATSPMPAMMINQAAPLKISECNTWTSRALSATRHHHEAVATAIVPPKRAGGTDWQRPVLPLTGRRTAMPMSGRFGSWHGTSVGTRCWRTEDVVQVERGGGRQGLGWLGVVGAEGVEQV